MILTFVICFVLFIATSLNFVGMQNIESYNYRPVPCVQLGGSFSRLFACSRTHATELLPTTMSPIKAAVRPIRFLIVEEHNQELLAFSFLFYFFLLCDYKRKKVTGDNTFYYICCLIYFPFVLSLSLLTLCVEFMKRAKDYILFRLVLPMRPYKNKK